MVGVGSPPRDTRFVWLALGVAVGLCVGLLIGAFELPHSSSSVPSATHSVPSGLPPVSNCFGGGGCSAADPTTNGSGTSCIVSGFAETPGDFLYVAISYTGGSNKVTSVADDGADSFNFVAGEFANNESVAFYDVMSVRGGSVTVTVALSSVAFGTCTVGQLTAGTELGVVGPGASTPASWYLSVTNAALHEPALIMALFGATRPTGTPSVTISPGGMDAGWQIAGQWTGYTYDGAAQVLYGENDVSSGTVEFTWQVGNSQTPSISGIALEFYLGS